MLRPTGMRSAREMASPGVSAAQTRLVTTPRELVSPSTQRKVAVTTPLEYVSPLVRRQRGIASPQVLQPRVQENNDDAERRERRRSTVRDLHIQQLCSPGTPSTDKLGLFLLCFSFNFQLYCRGRNNSKLSGNQQDYYVVKSGSPQRYLLFIWQKHFVVVHQTTTVIIFGSLTDFLVVLRLPTI